MALIVLVSVVMFSGCVEEEALESTPTPELTYEEKLANLISAKVSVPFDVVVYDNVETGGKNIFVTCHRTYHDWLLHEVTATDICKVLYTSEYADTISSVTVFFKENGRNLVKLELEKEDAKEIHWDDVMWIKSGGWTSVYFDPSLKRNE